MLEPVRDHIGAVSRRLSVRRHRGREAKVVALSQTDDADIADVWDTYTSPGRIPRWFLPVTGVFEVGGRYQLEGNAGGEILDCEPPQQLTITWEYAGDVSWVELRLSELADGRTRLDLEHVAHVDDERWEQFGPGAVGVGWDLALLGLDTTHMSGAAPVDPQQAMGWQTSDEGRRFMARSSEQWGQASIRAGTTEGAAVGAAARTTAAYMGSDPAAEPTG